MTIQPNLIALQAADWLTLTRVPPQFCETRIPRLVSVAPGPVAEASTRELCKAPNPGSNPGRASKFSAARSSVPIFRILAYDTSSPYCHDDDGTKRMASMEREFYRGARGPAPSDTDFWRLVLDETGKHLLVRHEWRTARHSGSNDFTLADFLGQESAARDALIRLLFEEATADA